jgi:RNA polymerase sigma-70 factor (TIGR02960 family)
MNGRRRPTIEDVAAEAGVSRGTVSRVLNGGHYVSPATLDAVNRAIKKSGYVVNQHARSLVTQRSESVAFILSEPAERLFTDPNFAVLLRGCTQALAEHDIGLFVCIAATASERIRVTRFLGAGHVDGALLVSAHAGDPLFKLLATAGVPAVAIGAPLGYESTIAYVAADDRSGARAMVTYLQSTGRTRIATVSGPLDTSGGQQRLEGYRDVVAAAFDPTMVEPGDYSQESGERAMSLLLERHPDLDAVFVASDVMALGALVALRRADRRVPEDVAVGGFDDSSAAVAARPALTTMRQPLKRISNEMVRLLLAALDGEPPVAVILPTELIRRESALAGPFRPWNVSAPAYGGNVAETATTSSFGSADLEVYRRELTGYCYRMLGSAFEADDAVQETRASLRSWLYRIATNVCLDALRGEKRRALPMDLGPSSPPIESLLRPWPTGDIWVTPIPDALVMPEHGDPAEIAELRDSVRLAFVTALQHLPPRQRAALILCEVLKLSAAEARATLAELPDHQRPDAVDPENAALLDQYVDAFQRYDMPALLEIIREDAVMTMPPFELWIRGNTDITTWMVQPGPSACADSVLVPVRANGVLAWGQYKPDPHRGGLEPWALLVHEVRGGKLSRMTFFLDVERLFPLFGLADRIFNDR